MRKRARRKDEQRDGERDMARDTERAAAHNRRSTGRVEVKNTLRYHVGPASVCMRARHAGEESIT